MQLPDPSPAMGPHATSASVPVHHNPQVYVRLTITLSYDSPAPSKYDVSLDEGAVRGNEAYVDSEIDRCGREIKRAVQKALLDDMLAARLGGTPTIMAISMNQSETSPGALAMREVAPRMVQLPSWDDLPEEYRERLRQAGREMFAGHRVEAYQRRPSPRDVPRGPAQPGDLGYQKPHVLDRLLPDDDDIPPNAGSAQ